MLHDFKLEVAYMYVTLVWTVGVDVGVDFLVVEPQFPNSIKEPHRSQVSTLLRRLSTSLSPFFTYHIDIHSDIGILTTQYIPAFHWVASCCCPSPLPTHFITLVCLCLHHCSSQHIYEQCPMTIRLQSFSEALTSQYVLFQ